VKEIKTYYYLVIGFLIVGYFLSTKITTKFGRYCEKLYRLDGYFMGNFLASYGIYLFVLFLTIGKTEKPKN
jgi:hypothetical protein